MEPSQPLALASESTRICACAAAHSAPHCGAERRLGDARHAALSAAVRADPKVGGRGCRRERMRMWSLESEGAVAAEESLVARRLSGQGAGDYNNKRRRSEGCSGHQSYPLVHSFIHNTTQTSN